MGKDPKGLLKKATKISGAQIEDYISKDKIGGHDLNDLYRFKVGDRSAIDLAIDKLKKTDANVELFRFKRSLKKVNQTIGSIDFSGLSKKEIRKNLKRVGWSRNIGKTPDSRFA